MKTKHVTRALAASTLLAVAGPALAQDAPTLPSKTADRRVNYQEPLSPPRALPESPIAIYPAHVAVSGPHETAPCPAPSQSWWKRCKMRFRACFGYESEFDAVPLGAFVDAAYRTHIANGEAARMVLYHYDFVGQTASLNTHGQDGLAKIATLAGCNGFPIIIERTPMNPALAEARRLAVINRLAGQGFVLPPERVVVGAPVANGLNGVEAEVIYLNLLSQTRDKGRVTGGASGFVGAGTNPSGAGGPGGGGPGGGTGVPPSP